MGLILANSATAISQAKIELEKEASAVLPHSGVLHDMGSTTTHKDIIVRKHTLKSKATSAAALR
ncbi:MAG: DUF1670 domain-containing protein [Prevotellaceae bacterium]|nr:DUF1670 domain-containing protein [Prevotellaceae bacterium]